MDELLIVHVLVSFSTILVGLLCFLIQPEKPNKIMGFRTKRSMKSIETWKFANDKFGRLMLWNTLVVITIQIFTYFTLSDVASILITTTALVVGIGLSYAYIEMQLNDTFDQNGKPKRQSDF